LLLTLGDGVRLFDPNTARPIGPFLDGEHPVRSFCVSKTHDTVLVATDFSIRMWRLPVMASAPVSELRRAVERDTALSLTADGEIRKLDAAMWAERLAAEAK
jgi:hypothetical protein